jgi:hypothetical protein
LGPFHRLPDHGILALKKKGRGGRQMDKAQQRRDAMEKLRREISDLEGELITARRRWKNSSEVLRRLNEEKERKAYRLSQFEEIMGKVGLLDGYDPDELYLVLLTNRKRILEGKQTST